MFYRSVRDLTIHSVPGTQGVTNFWLKLSPDGRQVSFLRGAEELWAVPLDGSGALQRIFSGPLWSWTWVEQGGNIDWLGVPAAPFWNPTVSPDGKTVAVSARFDNDQQRQIYLIDLERLVPRRLTSGSVHTRGVWSPDGEELVFNSTRDGHLNLYRAPVSGGAATRLTTSPFDQHPTDWSRDGRLVYMERLPYDRARILARSPTDPEPVDTLLPAQVGSTEDGGALSPDGEWLAFVKEGQKEGRVFVRGLSIDGQAASIEEQVSPTGGQVPRWRPDGRALLYASLDGQRILAVSVDTRAGLHLGREAEVFVAPDGIELSLVAGFQVAPGGRLLVVARERRTAPVHVVLSMNLVGR